MAKEGILEGFAFGGFDESKMDVLVGDGVPMNMRLVMADVDTVHFVAVQAPRRLIATSEQQQTCHQNPAKVSQMIHLTLI